MRKIEINLAMDLVVIVEGPLTTIDIDFICQTTWDVKESEIEYSTL